MPVSKADPHLILTLTIQATGSHPGSWKSLPDKNAFWDFEHYRRVAQLAHEATFDSLWLPDVPYMNPDPTQTPLHAFDPTILMTALAVAVPDIGVVPTVSTSYNDPYSIARQIASLDVISGGRGGINAITSYTQATAENYGDRQVPEYAKRHKRADEFLEIFQKLSDSWTIPADGEFQQQGLLFDPELARPIDFEGEFFKVKGPLSLPQPPHGRPLISVAGGSDYTLDLAAKRADVVYAALVHKSQARAFSQDVRRRTGLAGRLEDDIKILPGFMPVIGSTVEEAERKLERLAELGGYATDPVQRVADILSLDPKDLHPDRPLTPEQMILPESWSRPVGFFHSIVGMAREYDLTVRQIARCFQLDIGHRMVVGTPDTIAESMLDWWRDKVVDGFVLRVPHIFEDTEIIKDEVIPILRKAGAYPDGYKQETLRSRLGVGAL